MRRSVILAAIQGNAGSSDADASGSSNKAGPSRLPSSSSSALTARNASGGGFGALLNSKPFKSPFAKAPTRGDEGGRKRKRISYKGMGEEGGSDGESDGEGAVNGREAAYKKSKKGKDLEGMYKGIDAQGVSLNVDNRKWAVFKPKSGMLTNRFSLPTIKTKDGNVIETQLSHAALGTRRAIEIPPRPLYDPMGEHAIVLFDPTVDDTEAEKEKIRLQQEQAARENDAKAQQSGGMHKSLASILGLDKKKVKVAEKVPVVIDPRLGKVLRPHQIEGVKVCCATIAVRVWMHIR